MSKHFPAEPFEYSASAELEREVEDEYVRDHRGQVIWRDRFGRRATPPVRRAVTSVSLPWWRTQGLRTQGAPASYWSWRRRYPSLRFPQLPFPAAACSCADQPTLDEPPPVGSMTPPITAIAAPAAASGPVGDAGTSDELGPAAPWRRRRHTVDGTALPFGSAASPGRAGFVDRSLLAMPRNLRFGTGEVEAEAEDAEDELHGGPADAVAQARRSPGDDARRARAKQQIAAALAAAGTTVEAWFAEIDPHATFLGTPIRASSGSVAGVHRVLVQRLQRVEQRLMKELGVHTPAECARALNLRDVSGLRVPKPATGGSVVSMHCFGLAIDVNYLGNPFLQRGSKAWDVIARAVQLVTGRPADLNAQPSDPGAAWDRLKSMSDALKTYFQLGKDVARLAAFVARAPGTGRDAAGWQRQIASDYQLLDHHGSFVGRDPAKGFLDLDRRLVVALVETGGLLWGGMYSTAGGKDVMHFDWRGPRKNRNDPRSWLQAGELPLVETRQRSAIQRTRPATAPSIAASGSALRGQTIYAPISLGQDVIQLPARTGIYIPQPLRDQQDVDVIVYLHGFLLPLCGNRSTDQVDRYWTRERFPLREGLDQTGRNFVLVVPSLGPKSQSGSLRRAGGFDAYMKQVLAALSQGGARPRDIGRIILACHSGGGKTMRAIAAGTGTYASRIHECWGFDCLYGGDDPEVWAQWARTHRDARLYIHHLPAGSGSGTAGNSAQLRAKRLANVVVPVPPGGQLHCDVPRIYWQERIQAALPAGTP